MSHRGGPLSFLTGYFYQPIHKKSEANCGQQTRRCSLAPIPLSDFTLKWRLMQLPTWFASSWREYRLCGRPPLADFSMQSIALSWSALSDGSSSLDLSWFQIHHDPCLAIGWWSCSSSWSTYMHSICLLALHEIAQLLPLPVFWVI